MTVTFKRNFLDALLVTTIATTIAAVDHVNIIICLISVYIVFLTQKTR